MGTGHLIEAHQPTWKGEAFERLRALRLTPEQFVIFGSGPLVVRGVIEATNDLDVLCRGAAWDSVCAMAPPKTVEPWNVELVTLWGGRLTFGRTWAIGEVDADELIDTAEIFDGLPFARLEHVVAYKKISGRPKDLRHLAALARWTEL